MVSVTDFGRADETWFRIPAASFAVGAVNFANSLGLKRNGIHAAAQSPDLSDLRQIVGEFVFLDDKKTVFIRFDQPKIAESLHKQADPRPRRTHHLG